MTMLRSIILGFGHCGRNLHLASLRSLHRQGCLPDVDTTITVVDPELGSGLVDGLVMQRCLPEASALQGRVGVVHICTPPALHLRHVHEALMAGFRYIIIEKPMVMNLAEAQALRSMEQQYGAQILVVSVWGHSQLVPRLTRWLEASEQPLRSVHIVHDKPRFSRSFTRHGEHLFDIEMPHQVSLALLFAGAPASGFHAHTEDLRVEGKLRQAMKAGSIGWRDEQGIEVLLESDLASPIRQRSVRLQLESGECCEGFFPVGADDSYAQLRCDTEHSGSTAHQIFADEPLTTCVGEYYRYFRNHLQGHGADMPRSGTVAFNQQVVELLEQARGVASASALASINMHMAKEAVR
ncbi:Gfo/Idh/MocA family oxidoreductase [Pseudomonas viciae]|uniref:Gfo/Idh/MocA family oxidoreductase n=1 Tax=Pseudomonas viciae TaxID=2505979 RepID=UPI00223447C6|nr:Gfo/Idh/MocA family oxidoreductase [Pseudomonas viciae]UZE84444.1 Gfo/Idh/MocA family oxidoreductase [Pseudomonas viciae]